MSTNCQSNEIMLNIVQYRSNVGQPSNCWLSQIYTRFNFVGLFNDKKNQFKNSVLISDTEYEGRAVEKSQLPGSFYE